MQRHGGGDDSEEEGQMSVGKKPSAGRTQSSPGEKKGDADGRKSWKSEGRTLVSVGETSRKFERRVVLVRRRVILKE